MYYNIYGNRGVDNDTHCDGTGGAAIPHKEKERRANSIAGAIPADCHQIMGDDTMSRKAGRRS